MRTIKIAVAKFVKHHIIYTMHSVQMCKMYCIMHCVQSSGEHSLFHLLQRREGVGHVLGLTHQPQQWVTLSSHYDTTRQGQGSAKMCRKLVENIFLGILHDFCLILNVKRVGAEYILHTMHITLVCILHLTQ